MSEENVELLHAFSGEDDTATIHTHQRRIITELRNHPAAQPSNWAVRAEPPNCCFSSKAALSDCSAAELPALLLSRGRESRRDRDEPSAPLHAKRRPLTLFHPLSKHLDPSSRRSFPGPPMMLEILFADLFRFDHLADLAVPARAAADAVLAGPGMEEVVAGAAEEQVVAILTENAVVAGAAV